MSEIERIESIRNLLKFNKKTFSEVLGYTHSQNYTKYLNGTSNLSIKAIKALIDYDNRFNINWILTGEGEMFLNNETFSNQKIINGDGNITQIGDNSKSKNNIKNSNTTELEYLKKEIENLNKLLNSKDQQLEDKEARLRDKERFIALLEKNQK
jgi:hypothetical protein